MKILYVDDEPLALRRFRLIASGLPEVDMVFTCQSAAEAMQCLRQNALDAVFLDIEMPGMNGLALAGELHRMDESIRLFFVTAYDQYALEAFQEDALGYILKPFTTQALQNALRRARRMRDIPRRTVYIQTIPVFDVYIDGELFPIASPKPKELLALLVDRNGSALSSRQAISILWEDRPDDSNVKALYRMTCKRLRDMLGSVGIDFILGGEGTLKFIRPQMFACDYFRFLQGDHEARAKYNGEYLAEYSWAEETNARLANLKHAPQENR